MKPMKRFLLFFTLLAATLAPSVALAHHEAIFGFQSALVLSAPAFVSLQGFSRQTGISSDRTQETTFALSGGVTPFSSVPLSFTLVMPASNISEIDRSTSKTAPEDAVVGARYRFDLTSLQKKFERDGNYVLVMAGAEFPNGSMDHDAFHGPMDFMFAGVGALEISAFTVTGFGVYRLHGASGGDKPGNQLFFGGGFGYTPWDDPVTEKLVSLQLGWSYETYFRDREAGVTVQDSGGSELLLHPTLVMGPGSNLLLFALVSVPVARSFRDPLQQDRWRVGTGVTYLFR